MGNKWLISASGTAKAMNLITYGPRAAEPVRNETRPLRYRSHLPATYRPPYFRGTQNEKLKGSCPDCRTVWLRESREERLGQLFGTSSDQKKSDLLLLGALPNRQQCLQFVGKKLNSKPQSPHHCQGDTAVL